MKYLTFKEFAAKSAEELANYNDEALYVAAVRLKKINSGNFKVVK